MNDGYSGMTKLQQGTSALGGPVASEPKLFSQLEGLFGRLDDVYHQVQELRDRLLGVSPSLDFASETKADGNIGYYEQEIGKAHAKLNTIANDIGAIQRRL